MLLRYKGLLRIRENKKKSLEGNRIPIINTKKSTPVQKAREEYKRDNR